MKIAKIEKKKICPICRKELIDIETESDTEVQSYFPFCSKRCQLMDLGSWACESYRFPVGESSRYNKINDKF